MRRGRAIIWASSLVGLLFVFAAGLRPVQVSAAGSPIPVATCAQLQAINTDVTASYQLTNDIDCSGVNFQPIMQVGTGDAFTGTLDGNNHTIRNLHIDTSGSTDSTGLLGQVRYGAVIKDLTIADAVVKGGYETGILAGEVYSYYGHNIGVQNVHVSGRVSAQTTIQSRLIGGLIGYNLFGDIIDSSAAITIEGADTTYVGGLVGASSDGRIVRSYASGSINCSSLCEQVGGLSGDAGGSIEDSYSSVTLDGALTTAGGLLGTAEYGLTIDRSYASGAVSSNADNASNLGGLIGLADSTTVQDSFALGAVNASGAGTSYIGGLIGNDNGQNTYSNTYAVGNVSAAQGDYVGGLTGGLNGDSSLSNSFARNRVSAPVATNIGGIAGAITPGSGSRSNTYYDQTTSTQSVCATPATSCSGVSAVNTTNQDPSYFFNTSSVAPFAYNGTAAWDFTATWQTTRCGPVLRSIPTDSCPASSAAAAQTLTPAATLAAQKTAPASTLVDTGAYALLPSLAAICFMLTALAVARKPAQDR